jgi:hypothetical protein
VLLVGFVVRYFRFTGNGNITLEEKQFVIVIPAARVAVLNYEKPVHF